MSAQQIVKCSPSRDIRTIIDIHTSLAGDSMDFMMDLLFHRVKIASQW